MLTANGATRPQIVGVRLGRGFVVVSQDTADVEQHQSQGDTRRGNHEPAILQHQRQHLHPDY